MEILKNIITSTIFTQINDFFYCKPAMPEMNSLYQIKYPLQRIGLCCVSCPA